MTHYDRAVEMAHAYLAAGVILCLIYLTYWIVSRRHR